MGFSSPIPHSRLLRPPSYSSSGLGAGVLPPGAVKSKFPFPNSSGTVGCASALSAKGLVSGGLGKAHPTVLDYGRAMSLTDMEPKRPDVKFQDKGESWTDWHFT